MKNRLYENVGVSTTPKGVTKLRFTNDVITQLKRYKRLGQPIQFTKLPASMSKLDAAQYMTNTILKPNHPVPALTTEQVAILDACERVIARFTP